MKALSMKLGERFHRTATRFCRWLVKRRGYRWVVLLFACGFVELCYVFISSAGRFTNWPTYGNRVDQLAEAFRSGHLYVLEQPPAALVNASNPLDPANSQLWLWDASLYKGRYYFYWGPVPALLLAATKTALRVSTSLGEHYIVFTFASLQLFVGTALLERIARRLFGDIPIVLVALAVIALGLANPAPFILARQNIYETAIVSAHALVLCGIALAFEAVLSASVRRRSILFALAAGIVWALALGCRITVAPALPVLALTTALGITWHGSERWKRLLQNLVAMGAPMALGAGGLLAYNKARFDQWLEFGTRYQLTWIDFKLSSSFVGANVYSYALRPLQTSCTFPFVFSPMGLGADVVFPKAFKLPPDYFVYEQVSGALVTTPWAWFSAPALVLAGVLAWRAARSRDARDAAEVAKLWTLVTLLMAWLLPFVAPLCINTATMRYLGDASGAFMLFATLGVFATYAALRRAAVTRWLSWPVFATAAVVSAAIGLALGMEGYYGHFRQHNPALLSALEKRYSVCSTPKP
jgi:hypothetical protein